jgi:hypothetical protein
MTSFIFLWLVFHVRTLAGHLADFTEKRGFALSAIFVTAPKHSFPKILLSCLGSFRSRCYSAEHQLEQTSLGLG